MTTILIAAAAVVLLGLCYWMYAKAVALRNRAQEGLSAVDVQLQKRRDLLPNVLRLAQRFMEHERDLLEELTALRARVQRLPERAPSDPDDASERLRIDDRLTRAFGSFFAVAENYPDLRSQETVVNAQDTYREVEGHIAAARRYYNANVTDLNNWAQTFPMSLFSRIAGARPLPWFQATDTAQETVNADNYLR
ncbi:LemA family protein [Marinibaculum pumilum]|uniref:LemA family protein n=1 Tax=Marinibaculum pumilum TaxID=1766165 RepID=A0ABV7L3J2_9PROT